MHTFNRRAAFAYRGSAAFHRVGAHVAGAKGARPARLQRPRGAGGVFPRGRVCYRVASFDEALFIALDPGRQQSARLEGWKQMVPPAEKRLKSSTRARRKDKLHHA